VPTQEIRFDARGTGDARMRSLDRPVWIFVDAVGAGAADAWVGRAPLPRASIGGTSSQVVTLALGHPLRFRETADDVARDDPALFAGGRAALSTKAKLTAVAAVAFGGSARLSAIDASLPLAPAVVEAFASCRLATRASLIPAGA
jgi:hypothetical protein